MTRATDIRVRSAAVHWLPIQTRLPIKFGAECVTHVTCARVRIGVTSAAGGKPAHGWGETPLSVQWMWPSRSLSYETRLMHAQHFCYLLAGAWVQSDIAGHPLEIGHQMLEEVVPSLWKRFNSTFPTDQEPMPWLAVVVCCSAFDLAVHDAYGNLHERPTFSTFTADFLPDLSRFLEAEPGRGISFSGRRPADFLTSRPADNLPAWHLVGAADPLDPSDMDGPGPDDGYPVLLSDWIERDCLRCLKIKLRGNDAAWDLDRIRRVGAIALAGGCEWLSLDFNCMVHEPGYVNDILDRLLADHARLYGMILYVEQPFPYDLERHAIDVRSTAARKPLLLDESAHDWRLVRLGHRLGWSGVALKTCKTLTGAILMHCWARAHGMPVMVQDLANPMLALISHVLLAGHCQTLIGVEVNSVQFYPEASTAQAAIHPGLFRRRNGRVCLDSIGATGLGYRIEEICQPIPPPAIERGDLGAQPTCN